jgi:hypothetical protein
VSVACCLLLQRPQVLFDRVFALFSRSVHHGAVGCFVAALEPAVLADLLPGLPPEVMQVRRPAGVCGCVWCVCKRHATMACSSFGQTAVQGAVLSWAWPLCRRPC